MVNEHLPFNLPGELCEIIFDQLRAKDLLNCILVSKAFHDFIVQSTVFNKVTLIVNVEVKIKDVLKSNRKFTNFILLNIKQDKLIQCLKTFNDAKKIEIVGDCNIKKSVHRYRLPKLVELTLSNVSENIFHPIMNPQDNLRILNLHNLKVSQHEESSIMKFLKLNKKLTELNLYLTEHGNIFRQEIANDFQFNLQSVTISFRSNFEVDERTLANIEKFLITQGDTLKIISLINATSFTSIYRIWNDLRCVERFYFFSADPFFDNHELVQVNLEVKQRLKALEIHVLGPLQLSLHELQPILTAAKHLESLGVWNLTQDLVEYSAMNLMNLKSLFCATTDKDCENFYNQLKSKNGLNSLIKIHQYL